MAKIIPGGLRYSLISREQILTRGWLLQRKVRRQGVATATDRRVAMLLLPRLSWCHIGHPLLGELELIAYGSSSTERDAQPDTSQEGLGT